MKIDVCGVEYDISNINPICRYDKRCCECSLFLRCSSYRKNLHEQYLCQLQSSNCVDPYQEAECIKCHWRGKSIDCEMFMDWDANYTSSPFAYCPECRNDTVVFHEKR